MSDFWSRRRAAVEAEDAAEAKAEALAEAEARGAAAEARAETDAELCAALGLPDPGALGPGDDVSAFMARAVPRHLRRRALRGLWARDSRLANLDGLVDYGGDFTDAGLKAGVVATAYEVGRGIARRLEAADGPAQDDGALDDGARAERFVVDVRRPEDDGAADARGGTPDDGAGSEPDDGAVPPRGAADGLTARADDGRAVGVDGGVGDALVRGETLPLPGPPAATTGGHPGTPHPSIEAGSVGGDGILGAASGDAPPVPRRRMRFTFVEDAA